jgi:hypothetical protein
MHPRTKKKEKKPPNKAFLMKQYQYLPRRVRWNEYRLGVYNAAVMTVWGKIENMYAIDEKHQCFGHVVARILGKEIPKCQHLICNHALCLSCDTILSITRANKSTKFPTSPCVVSTCNSAKKHFRTRKMDKCKGCFVPVDEAPIQGFLALLLVIKKLGYVMPLDLRKYYLYPFCVPRGYYITGITMHTVVNVRRTKQDLINGLAPKCTELRNTFTIQMTMPFLRMKYAVLNTLKENPRAQSTTISLNVFCDELVELAKRMGLIVESLGEKIKISWDTHKITTRSESNLLRTDPKYVLLEYNP